MIKQSILVEPSHCLRRLSGALLFGVKGGFVCKGGCVLRTPTGSA